MRHPGEVLTRAPHPGARVGHERRPVVQRRRPVRGLPAPQGRSAFRPDNITTVRSVGYRLRVSTGAGDRVSIRARIALIVLAVSSALIFAGVWFFDQRLVAGMEDTIDETLDARAAPARGHRCATSGASVDRAPLDPWCREHPCVAGPRHRMPTERVVASSLGHASRRRGGAAHGAGSALSIVGATSRSTIDFAGAGGDPSSRRPGRAGRWHVGRGGGIEPGDHRASTERPHRAPHRGRRRGRPHHRRRVAAGQRRAGAGGADASRRCRHHRW